MHHVHPDPLLGIVLGLVFLLSAPAMRVVDRKRIERIEAIGRHGMSAMATITAVIRADRSRSNAVTYRFRTIRGDEVVAPSRFKITDTAFRTKHVGGTEEVRYDPEDPQWVYPVDLDLEAERRRGSVVSLALVAMGAGFLALALISEFVVSAS